MAESTAPDPVELWRELLTQWERSVNDMSAKVMTSGEFSSSANQLTAVVLKIQESLGDLLDKYFRALNLPTRRDVERIDERMMAIEDLLHSMGGMLERLASPTSEPAVENVATVATIEDAVVAVEEGADVAVEVPVDLAAAGEGRKKKRTLAGAPAKAKRPPRTKRPAAKKSPST